LLRFFLDIWNDFWSFRFLHNRLLRFWLSFMGYPFSMLFLSLLLW
jgi:hypothetical protein